jgi:hypothetical protein
MCGGFMKPLPIVCPIDAFEHSCMADERRFNEVMRGNDGDLEAFWRGLEGSPIHTAVKTEVGDDLDRCLCFWLHGDGVPTDKVDSLFSIRWGPVSVKEKTHKTRHVYAVVP